MRVAVRMMRVRARMMRVAVRIMRKIGKPALRIAVHAKCDESFVRIRRFGISYQVFTKRRSPWKTISNGKRSLGGKPDPSPADRLGTCASDAP
jgi:hypothetical protein